MKKLLSFLIFLAVGVAVFLVVMRQVGLDNIKKAFSLFLSVQGLVVLLVNVIFTILGVIKWRLVLKAMGHHFSLRQLSPFWLLGFAISYLTPFAILGGEVFRIYFLKRKFPELGWKKSVASVVVDKILDATVFFVFVIAGLLVFSVYGDLPNSGLGISAMIFGGIFLSVIALFYVKRMQEESFIEWVLKKIGVKKERIAAGKKNSSVFETEKEIFQFLSIKKKDFWNVLGLSFCRYGLNVLQALILVFFLTSQVVLVKSIAVYGFAGLATLTPLPATLGAFELSEGFAFRVLGFGFDTGTVFSMVWRATDLVVCLAGLIFVVRHISLLAELKISQFFDSRSSV